MTIDEKTSIISKGARLDGIALNADPHSANRAAIEMLSTACALLTSTSKEEREKGKQMVRRWKNGNSF